jgi:hypothetical protein
MRQGVIKRSEAKFHDLQDEFDEAWHPQDAHADLTQDQLAKVLEWRLGSEGAANTWADTYPEVREGIVSSQEQHPSEMVAGLSGVSRVVMHESWMRIVDVAVAQVSRALGDCHVYLGLLHRNEESSRESLHHIRYVAASPGSNMAGQRLEYGAGVSWSAIKQGKPVAVHPDSPASVGTPLYYCKLGPTRVPCSGPMVVAPLLGKRYPLGVLTVDSTSFSGIAGQGGSRQGFLESEVSWLGDVGRIIGEAVEGARKDWAVRMMVQAGQDLEQSIDSVYRRGLGLLQHVLPHVVAARM